MRSMLSPTSANGPLNGSMCATLMVSAATATTPRYSDAATHSNCNQTVRFMFGLPRVIEAGCPQHPPIRG